VKLTFARAPGGLTMLGAGAPLPGLIFYAKRRARRVE
jgi:hypothetical protein